MEIKPLDGNKEFDVFIGNAWDNWLRVNLDHSHRRASVVRVAEHVEVTPKLLELIYFKIKKLQIAERRAHESFNKEWENGTIRN